MTSAILLHVSGAIYLPFLKNLERVIYDTSLRYNFPTDKDQNVVIANIDEKSIQALGRWPWRRDVLAQMVNSLFDDYQIKALGFDMVFAEPSDNTPTEVLELLANSDLNESDTFKSAYSQLKPQLNFDQQFANSLEGRDVVLGIVFQQTANRNTNQLPLYIKKLEDPRNNSLVEAKSFVANMPEFHMHGTSGFFDNPLLDDDGVFRRVPVVQRFGKYVYPSLALQLARLGLGVENINLQLKEVNGHYLIKQVVVGDHNVPVTENGALLVPYRGPEKSFPYYSIIDILTEKIAPELLKDKVVLVGTDAAGLLDLRTTPFAKSYPGVEVHANIVAGILDGRVLMEPEFMLKFQTVSILVCALVLFILSQLRSVTIQIGSLVTLVFVIVGLNQWYWQQGIVMPTAPLLFLVIGLFFIQVLINMFVESRHKHSIMKMFGQYVPPELVTEMSKEPDKYKLVNESKTLTVLFSDIRNFTSISENLSADELSELMNRYLTRMTQIIHQHNGTIDKYMGDAIMAFWGAPIDDKQHASNAAKAALAMLEALDDLNSEFFKKGWPEIKIGVGVNTDVMYVGNMGSQFRMAYTVMGDGVNLASRLEGLTKQYGVECLVGENTAEELKGFYFQELDRVRVKGKTKPVAIFQLRSEHQHSLTNFADFLTAYRDKNWGLAESYCNDWKVQNSVLSNMYLSRINEYKSNPPEIGWDGTFSHQQK